MKKFLSLILALTILLLSLSFTACGDGEADDTVNEGGEAGENEGGENLGGESPTPTLDLIKDKVAAFTIVSTQKDAEINAAINEWKTKLASHGIEVRSLADYSVNKMQDCEILIGTGLIERDKYSVDVHDFGEKGYVIKVVDEKVVICGGSTASTVEAMALFLENYLGVNVAADDVSNVSISRTLLVEKVQDDYPIKNLTVRGEGVKDLYISASRTDKYSYAAAQDLQAALYSYAGVWMEIMSIDGDTSPRVRITLADEAGEGGFCALVDTDGNLTFRCEYKNSFSKGMKRFVEDVIAKSGEALDFGENYSYETSLDLSVVKYSEFGAVGDGRTDDFEAIIKTHAYANEGGQTVKADKGATYYIGSHRDTAVIKTNVDWGDAKFIIDDSGVARKDSKYWIFSVQPDKPEYSVQIPENYSLKKGATNVGLTFDTKVMLFVENKNKMVYIRYGNNANDGGTQKEVLLVDENGNIDPSTPPIFDYDTVTSMVAFSVDEKPLTIQGGTFTTYANLGGNATAWCGYNRGIQVTRSNTTLYNIVHLVEKEPEITDAASKEASCPYSGFFYVRDANNVLIDTCVMTSHKKYKHGTYDTQAARANNVTWKNCTQADRIDRYAEGYWGVMASNYVKNLAFDGCTLSRFDAHCGVYNVSIKNSEIGEVINLVGGGTCYIENTHLSSGNKSYFVRLREDYGSTWEGDIIIKNCKMSVKNSASAAYLIHAQWKEHYFGYDCYLPNLDVDGFEVYYLNESKFAGTFYIFRKISDSALDFRYNEINPIRAPKTISLKNIAHEYTLVNSEHNGQIFADTTITNGKEEQ
ncbi:MAG: hypothetical protein IJY65_02765 [Clostridia bacterium]|nr:hypothetical protein [Clostridia bacterium]